ncbi:MAG: putative squalene-hopene cyclase [Planctomycetota bacterium]|nr:MAG: putative squalene-hopene cyclase [Planctomycetota bacterium]
MTVRPALTPKLGKPSEATREFFLATLKSLETEDRAKLKQSTRPAQVIYLAAGLAEWDAHVTRQLAPETEKALSLMFEIQLDTGTWGTLDCWPPYESDAFHEATVAAMAAATAPGWLKKVADAKDEKVLGAIEKLKTYLRTEPPPHDYSRTLLLWTNSRMPGLVDDSRKQELIAMLFKQQRDDGGWSVRTFSSPEKWGKGNREKKLKDEPEFGAPPSDGHMTGLAIIVLREAGVPATDARIQKGVAWLTTNQRASGRWWTRSLNTDAWHFITYSGTAFPLLALQMCDALPAPAK